MKRRIKKIDEKVQSGRLTKKQAQQAVNAWLGHARHSNSYNLAKKIFEKYDYIQIEDKDWKFGDISPQEKKGVRKLWQTEPYINLVHCMWQMQRKQDLRSHGTAEMDPRRIQEIC